MLKSPLSETGKYPENEKLVAHAEVCQSLNHFFMWLAKQNVIPSKYIAFDAFPPNGESGDQIILRYLNISIEKLEAEKRAMFTLKADASQPVQSPARSEQSSPPAEAAPADSSNATDIEFASPSKGVPSIVFDIAGASKPDGGHTEAQEQKEAFNGA
jgi:hypothetical protein